MTGSELIAAERQRQIDAEGYDAAHDAGHAYELALAATCYALPPERRSLASGLRRLLWPWAEVYWKPTPDRIRELQKAGALIAAAIDSLQASSPPPSTRFKPHRRRHRLASSLISGSADRGAARAHGLGRGRHRLPLEARRAMTRAAIAILALLGIASAIAWLGIHAAFEMLGNPDPLEEPWGHRVA